MQKDPTSAEAVAANTAQALGLSGNVGANAGSDNEEDDQNKRKTPLVTILDDEICTASGADGEANVTKA